MDGNTDGVAVQEPDWGTRRHHERDAHGRDEPVQGQGAGKGDEQPGITPLPLQQTPSVVAQFRTSFGACWGATFSTPTVKTATEFKAKSD
jgi:hypothetical protein